jgi:hypothetical protein
MHREAKMKRMAAVMSCIALTLCACASKPQPSDYDVVLARPKPSTDEARRQECSWIETALARQKSLASYAAASAISPTTAIAHQDSAQRNMAVLESRAQTLNCRPAFANAPVTTSAQPRISFDECFSRCKQYTGRTSEQCFDACNK